MKKSRFALDSENRCVLPDSCVCCGSNKGLEKNEKLFRASSPLQLTAVLPWFVLGPAIKTAPLTFFICIIVSAAIFVALGPSARLVIPRCAECLSKKKNKQIGAAAGFFIGLILISLSTVNTIPILLPLGAILMFGAILYLGLLARRYDVRLAAVHGQEAVLSMPYDTSTAERLH